MRLPRWLTPWRRREPAPQGRHVRTAAPVVVPGAASALVAAAAEPVLAAEPAPTADPVPHPAPAPEPVDVAGAAPAAGEATAEPPVPPLVAPGPDPLTAPDPAPAALDVLQGGTPTAPGPVPTEPAGTVALGFADGAEVRLEPDDPRVAGLKAAADAVLEHP